MGTVELGKWGRWSLDGGGGAWKMGSVELGNEEYLQLVGHFVHIELKPIQIHEKRDDFSAETFRLQIDFNLFGLDVMNLP